MGDLFNKRSELLEELASVGVAHQRKGVDMETSLRGFLDSVSEGLDGRLVLKAVDLLPQVRSDQVHCVY